MTTSSSTILQAFLQDQQQQRVWQSVALALAGSLLIAVSARIQVPMWPVPMTMQSLAVLLIAMAGGARVGVAAVGLYLAQGAMGSPVFAGGGGVAHLVGPTAGYLWSFLAVAGIAGTMADRGMTRSLAGAAATAVAGSIVIYAVGATWLAAIVGADQALSLGVLPFLPGDLCKAALAVLLIRSGWKLSGN
jgi:biotin transport system substrate-specific component